MLRISSRIGHESCSWLMKKSARTQVCCCYQRLLKQRRGIDIDVSQANRPFLHERRYVILSSVLYKQHWMHDRQIELIYYYITSIWVAFRTQEEHWSLHQNYSNELALISVFKIQKNIIFVATHTRGRFNTY